MFIRAKNLGGKRYAYLVRNRWTKKGPRQKVSRYLGRVIKVSPERDDDFDSFITDPDSYSAFELVKKIVGFELHIHGFNEKKKDTWTKDDITVNLKNSQVKKSGKRIVLELNQDYMCNFTLAKLLRFKTTSARDEAARELATCFIQAGIPVRQDLFVKIFEMIYSPGQTHLRRNAKKRVILVSGTPATGKTTVSKKLAHFLDIRYLDVNDLISEKGLSEGYDEEKQCQVIDEDSLVEHLINEVDEKGVVIDSHMSHYVPPRYVDCCIITHCNLKVLKKRLQARGYSDEKVQENMDAEIFDICGQEAYELGHRVIEVNSDGDVDVLELSERIKTA